MTGSGHFLHDTQKFHAHDVTVLHDLSEARQAVTIQTRERGRDATSEAEVFIVPGEWVIAIHFAGDRAFSKDNAH